MSQCEHLQSFMVDISACESEPERRLAQAMAIIPPGRWYVCNQVDVLDYRADFVVRPTGGVPLVVEVDGFEFHSGSIAKASADAQRDADMRAAGYSVVRWAARDVLGDTQRCLNELCDYVGADRVEFSGVDAKHIKEILIVTFQRLGEGRPALAVPAGLRDVDALLDGGGRPGNLIIVAGRPGSGKTSYALQWVLAATDTSRTDGLRGYAYVATLEMEGEECATRTLTNRASVDGRAIRRGQMHADDWTSLAEAARELSERDIWINDQASTLAKISSEARQIKRRAIANGSDLAIIVVDYLQIMDLPAGETNEQEIAKTTKALKRLAKELSCPVVLLSQLNRGVESRENKRPLMSDVKGSGGIEADADIVIGLYRDEYYHPETTEAPGVAEVIVLKQRGGEVGTATVRYEKEFTRFSDLAQYDEVRPEMANDW
jgi:replicative DNA helicase